MVLSLALANHQVSLLLFFVPGTEFPGNEKITLCNTKSAKKSRWNEPYSTSSFRKLSCSILRRIIIIIIIIIITFLKPSVNLFPREFKN